MNEIDYIKKLLELGDKEGALKELNSRLKENPDNNEAWFILANTLDNPEEIKDCYRQIIRVDPNNRLAQDNLKHLVDESNKAEDSELPDKRKHFPVVKIIWATGILCVVLGIFYLLIRPDDINNTSSTSPPPTTPDLYTKSAISYLPGIHEIPDDFIILDMDDDFWVDRDGILLDEVENTRIGSYAIRTFVNKEVIGDKDKIASVMYNIAVFDTIEEADKLYASIVSERGAKPVENYGFPVDKVSATFTKRPFVLTSSIIMQKSNIQIGVSCDGNYSDNDGIYTDCVNIYIRFLIDKLGN